MRIRYTRHAIEQMARRGINRAQVQRVIDAPESNQYDPNQVSIRLERAVRRRILRVWVRAPWPPAGDDVTVKSAAWKGQ
jgi:hypothetical protein